MKLLFATLTAFPWNEIVAGEFRQLADQDRFGVHRLADGPEDADAILMVDLHQHPEDWRLRVLDENVLVRRFPHKVFVYDERDHPWCRWPGVYVSMRRSGFDSTRQRACSYSRIHHAFAAPPAAEPDLLFSFQGARSHPVRTRVLALRHPRALVEDPQFNFFDYTARAHTEEIRRPAGGTWISTGKRSGAPSSCCVRAGPGRRPSGCTKRCPPGAFR